MEDKKREEFHSHMTSFLAKWKDRETCFVEYFKNNYENRAGMDKYDVMNNFIVSIFIEKWAMSYRQFIHGDTDTNMYLERLAMNIGIL